MAPPLEPMGDEQQQLQAEQEVVAGEEENKDAEWCYHWPVFRFDRAPRRLYHFRQQFRAGESPSGNFLKGVKWSPDGSCFLTSSDDNTLRLFHLWVPSYSLDSYVSGLIVGEAETVYDYCWFPYMAASGVCLAYQRNIQQHSLLKGNDGPSGIVSSIAFSPTHTGMLAIGSYSQTTAIYSEDNMELLYVLHGQLGGVTQVLFSKDGNYLYTGGRKKRTLAVPVTSLIHSGVLLRRGSLVGSKYAVFKDRSVAETRRRKDMMVRLLRFFFFLVDIVVVVLPAVSARSISQCEGTCGSYAAPYPFGFSGGCPIPLDCSSAPSSSIRIGEFKVRNITSHNLVIDVPPACNRSINSSRSLFGLNYALTSMNRLFLGNCTANKIVSGGCTVNATLFDGRCGPGFDNATCFYNQTKEHYFDRSSIFDSGCSFLVTSVGYVSGASVQLLELWTAELEWWLDGQCQCSANADCTRITSPDRPGFRCSCREGFQGDGFAHGSGCRKG
ncbi:hypothetical protein B296_00002318 [Ensete ventricosum]|uniref:EGF-like domain-containing protein n=1 Tax=Ensete ventricosum TaxID=4639 RepID=A0A427BAQ8_ENSVE|nr:hypothetical protein B296_00002318 [Ensete ventricosum]